MRARIYVRLSIVSLITCFAATGATETLRQETDGGLRDSIWHNQPEIGFANKQTEYIDQAFRCAHETDRRALLFYGEARTEAVKRESGAVYEVDKDFNRRGLPIDCVALQRHIFNHRAFHQTRRPSPDHLEWMLPYPQCGQESFVAEDPSRQAEIYRQIATACLQHPGCTAIEAWGFTDKYSWIGWFRHGSQSVGLLFYRQYHAKADYGAVLQSFAARPPRNSQNTPGHFCEAPVPAL